MSDFSRISFGFASSVLLMKLIALLGYSVRLEFAEKNYLVNWINWPVMMTGSGSGSAAGWAVTVAVAAKAAISRATEKSFIIGWLWVVVDVKWELSKRKPDGNSANVFFMQYIFQSQSLSSVSNFYYLVKLHPIDPTVKKQRRLMNEAMLKYVIIQLQSSNDSLNRRWCYNNYNYVIIEMSDSWIESTAAADWWILKIRIADDGK